MKESTTLGSIGDTKITITAEGPKAQWCVDVLSERFERVMENVKAQLR